MEAPLPVAMFVPPTYITDHERVSPVPVAVTVAPGDNTVPGAGAVICGMELLVVRVSAATLNESKDPLPEKTAQSIRPSPLIHLVGNCMPPPSSAVSLNPPQSSS